MPADPLARRFAYNTWANRETLRSLRDASGAGPLPDRAPALVAHLVAAERLWLGRLGQPEGDPAQEVWPSYSLDESGAHLDALARAWPAILDRFLASPDGLDRPATYTNSQGLTFTNRAGDIFEHLLLHAHYHRGQVAALLGRAGRTPAFTDFIHWVRTGEPGPGDPNPSWNG
jgi:uncharacterized damage-inducible protein DinB